MNPSDEPAKNSENVKRVPNWLSALIVLLCLGGAGWLGWKTWNGDTASGEEFDAGTITDQFVRFNGRPNANVQVQANLNRDGIHETGANIFRVQSGDFYMLLAPIETTFAPMRMYYNKPDLLTPDQRRLLRICNETANAAFAKAMEITPDQEKKLAAIRPQLNGGAIRLSDPDRLQLQALWKAWNAADKSAKGAAETKLLAAEKDAGNRNLATSRAFYAPLADQVKAIVTDQQVARYRQIRGQ